MLPMMKTSKWSPSLIPPPPLSLDIPATMSHYVAVIPYKYNHQSYWLGDRAHPACYLWWHVTFTNYLYFHHWCTQHVCCSLIHLTHNSACYLYRYHLHSSPQYLLFLIAFLMLNPYAELMGRPPYGDLGWRGKRKNWWLGTPRALCQSRNAHPLYKVGLTEIPLRTNCEFLHNIGERDPF